LLIIVENALMSLFLCILYDFMFPNCFQYFVKEIFLFKEIVVFIWLLYVDIVYIPTIYSAKKKTKTKLLCQQNTPCLFHLFMCIHKQVYDWCFIFHSCYSISNFGNIFIFNKMDHDEVTSFIQILSMK
jgi:hypothetical protein